MNHFSRLRINLICYNQNWKVVLSGIFEYLLWEISLFFHCQLIRSEDSEIMYLSRCLTVWTRKDRVISILSNMYDRHVLLLNQKCSRFLKTEDSNFLERFIHSRNKYDQTLLHMVAIQVCISSDIREARASLFPGNMLPVFRILNLGFWIMCWPASGSILK